jgi:hypothetical protein
MREAIKGRQSERTSLVEALGTTEALRRKVVVRVASCWACGAPGFWFSNMKPASKSARESLRTSTGALEVGTARMLTCGEEVGAVVSTCMQGHRRGSLPHMLTERVFRPSSIDISPK